MTSYKTTAALRLSAINQKQQPIEKDLEFLRAHAPIKVHCPPMNWRAQSSSSRAGEMKANAQPPRQQR